MVQVHDLERVIREHPFFADMAEEHLQLITGCAANEVAPAGSYLFREGSAADKFYLVRSGVVAVEIHAPARDPIVVQTITDGELLGWSWLVPPYRWSFDARAQRLTRLVSLDATCLRKKMSEGCLLSNDLLRRFVPVMADRLHHARLQMLDLYGAPEAATLGQED